MLSPLPVGSLDLDAFFSIDINVVILTFWMNLLYLLDYLPIGALDGATEIGPSCLRSYFHIHRASLAIAPWVTWDI